MFRGEETSSHRKSRSVKAVREEGCLLLAASPAPPSIMLPTPEPPAWSVNQALGEAFAGDLSPSSNGEETGPGPARRRAARVTPAAVGSSLQPIFWPRRAASFTRPFGDAALEFEPVGGERGTSSSCPNSTNVGTQGTREEATTESFALQRYSPLSIKLGLFAAGFSLASSRSTDARSLPESTPIPFFVCIHVRVGMCLLGCAGVCRGKAGVFSGSPLSTAGYLKPLQSSLFQGASWLRVLENVFRALNREQTPFIAQSSVDFIFIDSA